jgi:hypothetical protein
VRCAEPTWVWLAFGLPCCMREQIPEKYLVLYNQKGSYHYEKALHSLYCPILYLYPMAILSTNQHIPTPRERLVVRTSAETSSNRSQPSPSFPNPYHPINQPQHHPSFTLIYYKRLFPTPTSTVAQKILDHTSEKA